MAGTIGTIPDWLPASLVALLESLRMPFVAVDAGGIVRAHRHPVADASSLVGQRLHETEAVVHDRRVWQTVFDDAVVGQPRLLPLTHLDDETQMTRRLLVGLPIREGDSCDDRDEPVVGVLLFEHDPSAIGELTGVTPTGMHVFQRVAEMLPDVVFIHDLAHGQPVWANRSIDETLGWTGKMDANQTRTNLGHPDDVEKRKRAREQLLASADGEVVQTQFRMRHKQRGWLWFDARNVILTRRPDGSPHEMLGIMRDITDIKENESRLRSLAVSDPLTGLANRSLMVSLVERSMAAAERDGEARFALLYVDVDRFKRINATWGQSVGNTVLQVVGHRLHEVAMPGDTVCRFGSDEFGILLEDVPDTAAALRYAEDVRRRLDQPVGLPMGTTLPGIDASIGVVHASQPMESAEAFIRAGDIAMDAAKTAGGRRCVAFEPAMQAASVQQMQIEAELRRHVEDRTLALHYQPIVDLETGRIASLEGLLRWPDSGANLGPDDFLPVSTRLGLCEAIAQLVIDRAAADLVTIHEQNPDANAVIAINLAVEQLTTVVRDTLRRAMEHHQLVATQLHVEITESSFIDCTPEQDNLLADLRRDGLALHLDDFGVGFSSLSRVVDLPVTTIKLDRAFVRTFAEDKRRLAVVRAVLGLARELRLETVAEGIETEIELRQARALGFGYGQGFLLGEPRPLEQWLAVLDKPLLDLAAV